MPCTKNRCLATVLAFLALALLACTEEDMARVPSNYYRTAMTVGYTDIFPDSVVFRETCTDSFAIHSCNTFHGPTPRETIWNCNKLDVARSGDTILLRSSRYVPPNEEWDIEFQCLESFDRFLVDETGHGQYLGSTALSGDPEVRVVGDTLYFKQTLTFFDRGSTGCLNDDGCGKFLIRYPQYGTLDNMDSLQTEVKSYCNNHLYCNIAPVYYRVSWQEWIYVANAWQP